MGVQYKRLTQGRALNRHGINVMFMLMAPCADLCTKITVYTESLLSTTKPYYPYSLGSNNASQPSGREYCTRKSPYWRSAMQCPNTELVSGKVLL